MRPQRRGGRVQHAHARRDADMRRAEENRRHVLQIHLLRVDERLQPLDAIEGRRRSSSSADRSGAPSRPEARCARDSTRARRPSSARNRGSSPDRYRASRCDRRWRRSSPSGAGRRARRRRAASRPSARRSLSTCRQETSPRAPTTATSRRISSENRSVRRAASSSMPSPLRSRSPSSASIARASCGFALPERKIRVEPRDVRGAHRPGHRIARAVEHLLAVLAAIDGGRDGQPERLARQPRPVRLRAAPSRRSRRSCGAAENHKRVGIEAGPQLEEPRLAALLELFASPRNLPRESRRPRSPAGARRPPAQPQSHPNTEAANRRPPCASNSGCGGKPGRLAFTNGPKPAIGWRSSTRSPGANGAAKRISSVSGSIARTPTGCPIAVIEASDLAASGCGQRGCRRPSVRPGRSFTVYIRLSADAVHDSASQGSSSSVLRFTRTSGAAVSRSTASSIASVEPVSDPPRGSAASMSASLLGGAGFEDALSAPVPSELDGLSRRSPGGGRRT